ncbi:androgen-dependent TFPI-regulating protein [Sorex araneus]|uniref:androgen-dependent TFPI-regulating protein n=1 Tax=Sorex araneus TaxID=42254 RepID=UPI002433A549|nr:androgen-dependent TFPI-regulating protein [Sorex araneus]
MMKISFTLYHFIVLSWYIFLNYFILLQEEDTQKSYVFQDGGKWKYLTFLNLYLQAIFYGIAFLEDVLKGVKGKKDITFVTALRNQLFATLVFPISTFVFLTFWIIFLYDRELIYPKDLDNVFPVWLNHSMHTLILPFSLVEIFQRQHAYPSKKIGLSLLSVVCLSYMGRITWLYTKTGTWVYPMLSKLSSVRIAAFFFLSYIIIIGIYVFGEKLNFWKWGEVTQPKKKRK